MKRIIILLFILATVGIVNAQPFLVCDHQDNVDAYIIEFEGQAAIETAAPLHYDLNGLDPGDHKVVVKAKNGVWIGPPSIPLEFTKPSLSAPILGLQAD